MSNQHRIAIIGSIDENIELVKRAKERGIYTIVCDGYDKKYVREFADKTFDINVYDVDSIANMCIEEKVDGIVGSFSDLIFEQVTKIAAKAGLKWYATPEMLDYYRDKYTQKELLTNLGIKVPKFDVITKESDLDMLNSFAFPVVIKPTDGWGSKDIYTYDSIDELKEFTSTLSAEAEYEIEEYCDAYEYNSISWVVDGTVKVLGISDRERNPHVGNKIAVLNRIVYPSKHMGELTDKVTNILQKFIEATGQKNGPISMQFFYKNEEIVVCEIAGRVLGHEHNLIHYCGGSDIISLLLDYVYKTTESIAKDINQIKDHIFAGGIYFVCENDTYMHDMSKMERLFEEVNPELYQIFGEVDHMYDGSYPYLSKCYLKSDSREKLDRISEYLYKNMFVGDKEGKNIVLPFILENRD